MTELTLTIPGVPTAKGRPRFARVGKFVRAYTPKETEQAEETVAGMVAREVAQKGIRFDGPVELLVAFYLPRPKAHYKRDGIRANAPIWHMSRPDGDNLFKLILDSCNKSGVWRDDAQVASFTVVKRYANDFPRTVVTLRELADGRLLQVAE